MAHRGGGKVTSSHTTLIEAAEPIIKKLEVFPEVKKVTLGPIEQVRRASGIRVVKITDDASCVRLTITQKATVQLLFVYTEDRQETKLAIARFSRDEGYQIRFGDRRVKGEG